MPKSENLAARVAAIQTRAQRIADAPLLSRAGLAQEALSETLDLLADMAARLDGMGDAE